MDSKMIEGGFSVGIPDRRPIGKKSGRNWEGVGVIPDVDSGEHDPLDIALKQF